jgi:hypothetical protein
MSETCPKCGAEARRDAVPAGATHYQRWLCGAYERNDFSVARSEECYEREIAKKDAQLAAETKRADDLGDKLDNACGQLETLRRAEIRTSDLRTKLAAAEARAKWLVEEVTKLRDE